MELGFSRGRMGPNPCLIAHLLSQPDRSSQYLASNACALKMLKGGHAIADPLQDVVTLGVTLGLWCICIEGVFNLGFWCGVALDSLVPLQDLKHISHAVDIESTLREMEPKHFSNLNPSQTNKALGRLWYSQVRLRPLAGVAAETGEISQTMQKAHHALVPQHNNGKLNDFWLFVYSQHPF